MIVSCAHCPWEQERAPRAAAERALEAHVKLRHPTEPVPAPVAPPSPLRQMPAVTFHQQALEAILTLALSGRRFTIGEAHALVTVAAPNPRTDWAKAQREAEGLHWIRHVGFTRSVVAGTKGSAVSEWVGTAEAQRAVAAHGAVVSR